MLDARKHLTWTPKLDPLPHVCVLSVTHSVSLTLSLNVYEPLGAVYEKFIGSVGRVANLMLNARSVFFPSHAMTPPVSHVFQQMVCFRWSRGGKRREKYGW